FLRWRMALRIATRRRDGASTNISCMRAISILLVSAMLLAPGVPASFAQDEPTIKVDVAVVNILFNVRDKRGGLIANLNKDDFTLLEERKQQDIKYLKRETELPLTIGLVVDVSASQGNLIEIERNAAYQFFGSVLRK